LARRDALTEASEHWTGYLEAAEADHARYAPRAALHRASVARKLGELTAKLPKNRGRKPDAGLPLL
jgi:hypothetical protein